MKKYKIEQLKSMDGVSFAKDILQGELNARDNPYTPLASKLRETCWELDRYDEAKLSWPLLKSIFRAWEKDHPQKHLSAYIVFTKDSWPNESYTLASRTYAISSDNKAFQPNMGGYSIFGSCLDGTDSCIRLEQFMAEETGRKDGWKVDYCLLLSYRE